jgi:hypothetical protein
MEEAAAASIRELCGVFRRAIERTDRKRLPITLQDFPRGSCGEVAPLLGTFLKNRGMGTFQYICGRRKGHSHAWIEADGIIIDITADQFPEISERVIVTNYSPWHDSFEREGRPHEADYRIYDANTVSQCEESYGAIVENVET